MSNPIAPLIQKNKPTISASSLKTYATLLRSLYYRHHDKKAPIETDWFDNESIILADIAERPIATRKTILSALISVSPKSEKYKSTLMENGAKYQQWIEKQEKSETQEANWKTFDEVKKIYDEMHTNIKPILNHKGEISQSDFIRLQDFVILSLTSGVWIKPRRSADWVNMKLKSIDKSKHNYIEKNQFYFNEYKTKKFYGRQNVAIPKGLNAILTRYINHNPYDYLLVDNDGNKITNVRLMQRLNHIFKSKISTSMLRHIFLSDKLQNMPKLTEMIETAREMGHSVPEALQYVKR